MDEGTSTINVMEIEKLETILSEFGDNVNFNYDLKKKNWFYLWEVVRF